MFLENNLVWRNQHKYRLTAEICITTGGGKGRAISREAYFTTLELAREAQRNFFADMDVVFDGEERKPFVEFPKFRVGSDIYSFGRELKFAAYSLMYYSTKIEQYIALRSDKGSDSVTWLWDDIDHATVTAVTESDSIAEDLEKDYVVRLE